MWMWKIHHQTDVLPATKSWWCHPSLRENNCCRDTVWIKEQRVKLVEREEQPGEEGEEDQELRYLMRVQKILYKKLIYLTKMVNTCLTEELKEIHAFEQKTLTPEQWEKQKSQ
ncbi:uncharacterized protein zgc:112271 isoform X1 [Sparus aurata]|uniref:uncharacterized protein zgc:112271 isoform X1 n=1 Tax=Sparus aurata TaxID=8175 RepID=UPI0011C0CC38|nr:bolA-like protein 2 isoform X1 [Sparus aurata]XP_030285667.1 bolA-like protein 2 isoform X1 [Sparus aurata]XP_030285668.1 bolA-like protein 2 isoform X1 [Sparus aurata]XP_030285669.1 bolA-like protein 2 isoform X1 [Sparus aurata]